MRITLSVDPFQTDGFVETNLLIFVLIRCRGLSICRRIKHVNLSSQNILLTIITLQCHQHIGEFGWDREVSTRGVSYIRAEIACTTIAIVTSLTPDTRTTILEALCSNGVIRHRVDKILHLITIIGPELRTITVGTLRKTKLTWVDDIVAKSHHIVQMLIIIIGSIVCGHITSSIDGPVNIKFH